jgi:hypothetical protein
MSAYGRESVDALAHIRHSTSAAIPGSAQFGGRCDHSR